MNKYDLLIRHENQFSYTGYSFALFDSIEANCIEEAENRFRVKYNYGIFDCETVWNIRLNESDNKELWIVSWRDGLNDIHNQECINLKYATDVSLIVEGCGCEVSAIYRK